MAGGRDGALRELFAWFLLFDSSLPSFAKSGFVLSFDRSGLKFARINGFCFLSTFGDLNAFLALTPVGGGGLVGDRIAFGFFNGPTGCPV